MTRISSAVVGALAAVCAFAAPARAQSDGVVESAFTFLLKPIGARLVGIGGAGVADPNGQDALMSNPAGFARPRRRDIALDYMTDAVSSGYVVSAAVPVRLVGTFAAGIYVSPQETVNTDTVGTTLGRTIVRDVAYTASYATRFNKQFLAGLTYKYLQKRYDCSGGCDDPTLTSTHPATTAIDVGIQIDSITNVPMSLGVTLRNAGLPFQYKDNEQRDPLPTQLAFGAAIGVPGFDRYVTNATLRGYAEVTTGLGGTSAVPSTYHVGGELGYQKSLSLRLGYAKRSDGYSGPSLGIGFVRRRFTLDVARQLGASGLLADKPPTYVGVRYAF